MCKKKLCVIVFLSAGGCRANVPKTKYRQNVQGIIGLLERYAQMKLKFPISWEKQFLHWSQYHKLISSIVRNLLP